MGKQKTIIAGVNVNMNSPQVKSAKDLDTVRSLGIFSHLEEPDKAAAEEELAATLGIAKVEPKPERQPRTKPAE